MPLDVVTQALLLSYQNDGGANRADAANLPSRAAAQAIVTDYLQLVFPGYHAEDCPTAAELPGRTLALVQELAERLVTGILRSLRFAGQPDGAGHACAVTRRLIEALPVLRRLVLSDVSAAFQGDPSARSLEEIILAYPGVSAIAVQRFAHLLHEEGVPLLPRMLTEFAHERTGCDLHPGARIGHSFFADHGTGIVVGETATIGNRVRLYQGVTLGARSFPKDQAGQLIRGGKRHPDIEDDVAIYAHATILGGDTRIGAGSIIGSNVWLMMSLPARSVAYITGEHVVVTSRDSAGGDNWQI